MTLSPDIIQAFVRAIELKDACTAAHTWRVVLYARAMAERLGLDADRIARISDAAALHDLGKIDIPDGILGKPDRLTQEEFEIIKNHTTLGHKRLIEMGVTDEIMLDLVRHHHERWDGKGYPDGLDGEQITVGARLFSVIDTFDALTSFRPYRQEVGEAAAERAIEIIEKNAGSQFWPIAVEQFVDLYRSDQLGWILHHFNDQAPVSAFESTLSAIDFEKKHGSEQRPL